LADNMQDGVRIARDNPDSGVVVRIAGEGRPWNPGAITGGRVWGDIPDSSVQPGAGNGEPVTAEVLAQRQAEEAIRRETERRADEIVRKMAENKPDLPDGKTEQAVREIAGQERDRADITEREPAINRLWGWGIIAQFAYYLAGFPWYEGNILFAFAVAAQVLTWCETRSGWRTAAAILLMALWG
ncbi:TraX family protein, partial [Escherichia coli]